MKKKVCFLCDGDFIIEKWYGKCDRCKILRPESKGHILAEMESLLSLRTKLGEHLHVLEQKQISDPDKMTKQEKEEYDIWSKHNALYNELMVFIDQYNIKDIRFREIYPRLYLYMQATDKIKQIYKQND